MAHLHHVLNMKTQTPSSKFVKAKSIMLAAIAISTILFLTINHVASRQPSPDTNAPHWRRPPILHMSAQVWGSEVFEIEPGCMGKILEVLAPSVSCTPTGPLDLANVRDEEILGSIFIDYADGHRDTVTYYFLGNNPLIYKIRDSTFCRLPRTEESMKRDNIKFYGVDAIDIDEAQTLTKLLADCSTGRLRPATP
ncbi:hypothetical protein [Paludisphaera soli]|uniref:hypothetical protein n=1 Tax=Paludisphaera soli TaxID=2712865 RepID=UPI0013EDA9ED|nr:hypothetical protein [Paludisphaera soli]